MASQGPYACGTATSISLFTNPNNIKVSDNVRSIADVNSSRGEIQATNFGFSIPTGSTINGIVASLERRASGGTVRDYEIYLLPNQVQNKAITGTDWATAEATVNYGSSSDLWSESWTAEEINDTSFGLRVKTNIAPYDNALIDFISITVYYTAGSSAVVKTSNGLALASVKTFNGLALASTKTKNGAATV